MFLFFCCQDRIVLNFPFSEAGHVLKLFAFFVKFEPQYSYKHGSYKTKSVYFNHWSMQTFSSIESNANYWGKPCIQAISGSSWRHLPAHPHGEDMANWWISPLPKRLWYWSMQIFPIHPFISNIWSRPYLQAMSGFLTQEAVGDTFQHTVMVLTRN